MKWHSLPGPATLIESLVQQLRDGVNIVLGVPTFALANLEQTFVEHLANERWYMQQATVNSSEDPLAWLTETLNLEPEQWVGWNVEKLFAEIRSGNVIVIDGVAESNWAVWKAFLRDFEVVCRQRPSDERPVLLVIVRGVPQKLLQSTGAVLATTLWTGVFGELDMLIYVDQGLRKTRRPERYHKLIVRQIAALALWDIELADFLIERPERDLFDIESILASARIALGRNAPTVQECWENGGEDHFDGVKLLHPFLLLDNGDPSSELARRVWTAQAAELLPLIEVRRRELLLNMQRHVPCPFWIDSKRQIQSLDELEIGSLAYVAQKHKLRGDLRDTAEWLAKCRNTLAHLGVLNGIDALDARLHG